MDAGAFHHDPYREVEMYLEQAQEEIGRAFAELISYERNCKDQGKKKVPSSIPQDVGDINQKGEIDFSARPESPFREPFPMREFPRPPSGDMEKLIAWAEAFVVEVNTRLTFDDLDSSLTGQGRGEPEVTFRSLPIHRETHPRVSCSLRLPINSNRGRRLRRRHCRKMWSWPHGSRDKPLLHDDDAARGQRRKKTKDAQVQTTHFENDLADYWLLKRRSNRFQKEKNIHFDSKFPPSMLNEREMLALEAPSNWRFKNFLNSTKNGRNEESNSSEEDQEMVSTRFDVMPHSVTFEENGTLLAELDHQQRSSWSTVSSNSEEDLGNCSNCFSPGGGQLSSTMTWLAVEDDSDHLESKELPKLTNAVNAVFEVNQIIEVESLDEQKSASSTLSSVSRDELDTFLRKVASSVYQPPPASSALDKECPLQDAVTQTTPDLSRSSSFTWVTDCDCSDLSTRARTSFEGCGVEEGDSLLSSFSDCNTYSDARETCSSLSDEGDYSAGSSSRVDPTGLTQQQQQKQQHPFDPRMDASSSLSLSENGGGGSERDSILDERQYSSLEERSRIVASLEFKSSSAPLVMMREDEIFNSNDDQDDRIIKAMFSAQRSHSARQLTELEAIEASIWLRAAGFPQYAQMYEDNLFPIEISGVRKDHEFLDPDAIQSLFRRLNTLNKCARLKSDGFPRKSVDESDEDDHCALSENWQFQRSSRRWSRILPLVTSQYGGPVPVSSSPKTSGTGASSGVASRRFLAPDDIFLTSSTSSSSSSYDHFNNRLPKRDNTSRDSSVFLDESLIQSSPESLRKSEKVTRMGLPMDEDIAAGCCYIEHDDDDDDDRRLRACSLHSEHSSLRRSRSERVKDGARAFLRGVESLKVKRKKNRDVVIIGGPLGADDNTALMLSVDRSETSSNLSKNNGQYQGKEEEQTVRHFKQGWCADGEPQTDSVAAGVHGDESGDFECPPPSLEISSSVPLQSERMAKRRNGSVSSLEESSLNCPGKDVAMRQSVKRTQWLNTEQGSVKLLQTHQTSDSRKSQYDNVPPLATTTTTNTKVVSESNSKENSPSSFTRVSGKTFEGDREKAGAASAQEEMDIATTTGERRDSGVGSSLTRYQSGCSPVIQARWHCFTSTTLQLPAPRNVSSKAVQINTLPVSQLMVLRKFSLLKLTALMEKYSPSNRAGWNWGVPKFIRRIRTPDYKDKSVFGIPLLMVVQRTGQPLPLPIQGALNYLREEGLEAQGIFRKSGVRSRIQALRNQSENNPKGLSFENQQVYDVADMVKQYFRELPDALLTNKLSETFITIFQHIPSEFRLEATQAAILLMPDENRDALQSFLSFLDQVCQHSHENQMTAANLAVCLAPSLFHLSIPRSASASPRRRKTTVGVPDQKDLNENRAAHTCLTTIIDNYKRLFLVPDDSMLQCRLSSLEPCEPPELGDLAIASEENKGQNEGWKIHADVCIQGLLKEAREKFRGWVPLTPIEGIEVSYKKVGDGHPLKLWKVVVDVEAPPVELLNRILRERHLWDERLLKWQVVSRLDKQAEIFQYVIASMPPQLPRDYALLRSWKVDNSKGTCVLVETSVEHPEAQILMGGVRALVLASQFLIEPCGSGKSRVTHITRIDNRGHSPEWYNKVYGHNSAILMARLRDSFKQVAGGPETKV